MEKANNKIVKIDDDFTILCFGPFSHLRYDEMSQIYEEFMLNNKLPENVFAIKTKDSYPVLEYSLVI